MENTITNHDGKRFVVDTYYWIKKNGHGNWICFCEVTLNSNKQVFTSHTNDSQFIDNLSEIEGWDAKQYSMNNKFFEDIKERVLEWANN